MERFVNPFVADGSSATVIESGLILVIVGLACITAWMHVSASLNIPSVSTSTTMSVETTGSVRSRELHRASRTRRLRRSEKRLYGTATALIRASHTPSPGPLGPRLWRGLAAPGTTSPYSAGLAVEPQQVVLGQSEAGDGRF